MQNTHIKCNDRASVIAALDGIFQRQTENPVGTPAIQFVCHGSTVGIGKPEGWRITWEELRDTMRSIYLAGGRRLLLNMGSCRGFNVAQLITKRNPCPFSHICGTKKVLGSEDCLDGFYRFYRELEDGAEVAEAAVRVNNEVPPFEMLAYNTDTLWEIITSNYRRDYLKQDKLDQMLAETLDRNAEAIRADPSAKERYVNEYKVEAMQKRLSEWHTVFYS